MVSSALRAYQAKINSRVKAMQGQRIKMEQSKAGTRRKGREQGLGSPWEREELTTYIDASDSDLHQNLWLLT